MNIEDIKYGHDYWVKDFGKSHPRVMMALDPIPPESVGCEPMIPMLRYRSIKIAKIGNKPRIDIEIDFDDSQWVPLSDVVQECGKESIVEYFGLGAKE